MPIILTKLPASALRAIDQLSAHLTAGVDNLNEPFVVETRIGRTNSIHVLVIWDEWSDIDPELRSQVILDAYATSGKLAGGRVTAAIGVTQEEALRSGFLRYKLEIVRRQNDPVPLDELVDAYQLAGGVVQRIGRSSTRFYPTKEAVEDAFRIVAAQVPGPYWAIVHEVPVEAE